MSNQDIDDPFAQFDDLDSFDNDFDQGVESDTHAMNSAGADDFGDDMVMDSVDDDMGLADDLANEPVPSKPAATPNPAVVAGSTPFLKTPLGMATIGLAVVGLVGGAGTVLMSGGGDEVIAPETAAVIPPASEPSFTDPVAQAPVVAPVPTATAPTSVAPATTPAPIFVDQPAVTQAPTIQSTQAPFDTTPATQFSEDGAAELAEFIAEQRQEMKELNKAMSDLTKEIQGIKVQLGHNANADKAMKSSFDALNAKLDKRVEASLPVVDSTTSSQAAQSVTKATVKTDQSNALAKGRERVGDFQVVDATSNGQMVIIKKASSGRVFTVFKGEVLVIGGKRLTVQSIEGGGSVVFLGDKLYIDKVLASKPAPQQRVSQSAAKPKSTSRPVAKASAPRDAKGFTLNAVYDSDSSFGVVDNKGNFKSYRVGESVPELGGAKVQGLDASGNLKVGDYIIKSIY